MHIQANDLTTFRGTLIEGIWQAQVTNGSYDVTVSVGDGIYLDSKHSINAEGVSAIAGFVPTSAAKFKSATITVSVVDGFLTIDAIGGTNTKINSVIIKPSASNSPLISENKIIETNSSSHSLAINN